ncbi:Ig-like domain-containing protein [Roseivirga sp.]|uniref:Ig-like domain-containing protein n=1 Tax=Roseivirga sp. TaxID=1964215 RepID=UPI003B8BC9A8
MKLSLKLFCSFTLLSLAIFSCARIISPTGGPEDEEGPDLISSTPAPGETNFKGQTLKFSFSERVQARSLETDIVITPKPEGSFKSRINKNVVELTFFEPFKDSTTYSINFASSVQDVTNNNPADGVGLSFSTGPYIDSLSISGNIVNLYNQEPVENALVSLYQLQDSLNIIDGAASYYSKTDSVGNYSFNNLPSGEFRVYAVRDKNSNGIADTEKEKYGFYADTLMLNTSLSNIDMTLQNLNTEKLKTTSARPFGTYYDISFNKSITGFEVMNLEDLDFHFFSDEKIRFYNTSEVFGDTTDLIFSAIDSLNQALLDTAKFYFSESKLSKTSLSLQFEPRTEGILEEDTIKLIFNKPIAKVNFDSLSFIKDSLNVIPIDTSLLKWNIYQTELSIPLSADKLLGNGSQSAALNIKAAAFISVDQDSSKSQQRSITRLKAEDTAMISGTVSTNVDKVIVQLLDSRSRKIIRESRLKNFVFEFLPAGRYEVRVIKDLNANGKWDIGNILTNQPSEPAKFYFDDFYNTKVIEVRKNWEQTDVNINF